MSGRPRRWKEYDDVRTVHVREVCDATQETVVKRLRVPGWVQVEEGHEAGVTRALDDVKTGRLAARVGALESQIAQLGGSKRAQRARNTRQYKKMIEDLSAVDSRELARLICSRP